MPNVLLVHSNPDLRIGLTRELEGRGFQVTGFADIEGVLDAAGATTFVALLVEPALLSREEFSVGTRLEVRAGRVVPILALAHTATPAEMSDFRRHSAGLLARPVEDLDRLARQLTALAESAPAAAATPSSSAEARGGIVETVGAPGARRKRTREPPVAQADPPPPPPWAPAPRRSAVPSGPDVSAVDALLARPGAAGPAPGGIPTAILPPDALFGAPVAAPPSPPPPPRAAPPPPPPMDAPPPPSTSTDLYFAAAGASTPETAAQIEETPGVSRTDEYFAGAWKVPPPPVPPPAPPRASQTEELPVENLFKPIARTVVQAPPPEATPSVEPPPVTDLFEDPGFDTQVNDLDELRAAAPATAASSGVKPDLMFGDEGDVFADRPVDRTTVGEMPPEVLAALNRPAPAAPPPPPQFDEPPVEKTEKRARKEKGGEKKPKDDRARARKPVREISAKKAKAPAPPAAAPIVSISVEESFVGIVPEEPAPEMDTVASAPANGIVPSGEEAERTALSQVAAEPQRTLPTGPAMGIQSVGDASGPSVLVVDDEPAFRGFLRDALVARGYRVHTAINAPNALRFLKQDQQPIDLVISDLSMPHMDGFELKHEIDRWTKKKLPFIVVTGDPTNEKIEIAAQVGAAALVPKPIEDLDAFYAIVDDTLRDSRKH